MLTTILIALVLIVAVVLVYAATRPAAFRVQRATTINARPQTIFPLIADFRNWASWSPYEKLDPAMKKTLSGASSGKGAVYEWEGNSKAGTGRMQIIEATPASKVTIKLDFMKPFEAHNVADFTLDAQGDSTKVTWAMHGPSPFVARLMGIFMSMDKLVGKEFETGLANLKTLAET